MSKEENFEYGPQDIADALNVGEAQVRIKLRNANIKKLAAGGTRYGWKTKAEIKEVVEKLKATKSTPIPAAERKGAGKAKTAAADAKPAKGKKTEAKPAAKAKEKSSKKAA